MQIKLETSQEEAQIFEKATTLTYEELKQIVPKANVYQEERKI